MVKVLQDASSHDRVITEKRILCYQVRVLRYFSNMNENDRMKRSIMKNNYLYKYNLMTFSVGIRNKRKM